jgi:hypothetical protein
LKPVAQAKKLSHHPAGCPAFKPPQATRPSTSGGPVAFRPPITRGLALSRVIVTLGFISFENKPVNFQKALKKRIFQKYSDSIILSVFCEKDFS